MAEASLGLKGCRVKAEPVLTASPHIKDGNAAFIVTAGGENIHS